jgi:hypothetical protein
MQRRFHNCLSYVLPNVIKAVADRLERMREETAVGLRNVLDMNLHGGTEEYQVKLQYNGLSVVQSVI